MFSIYSRSRLHSFGEIVQPWRFWWMTPLDGYSDWDLAARNLRSARWLHKRVDVDFNGWFMCLIPRQVLEEIGLSLPLFIKWDDLEFGLRAKEAGFPTVTFPGAAVWHIPWTDKNDAVDWQAYFHHRNRFVAALLHSPYPNGGRLIRESLNHQIKHLVSMQYSTVEIRHQALLDVLAGPHRLHADLPTKLGEVNAFRKQFTDAQLEADPDAFPPVRRKKPPRKGRDGTEIPGRLSQLITAGLAPIRQLRPVRELSQEYPEAEITAMDAKWYRLAPYDSAVVSMNDGTSAALYQRDPAQVPRPAQARPSRSTSGFPRVAAAGRGVPRRARRDHLAGGVGEDLRAVDGRERGRVMTDRPPAAARRGPLGARRAAGRAVGDQGRLEVVPAPLPAAAAGHARDQRALPGSFLGLLWSYINPLTQFFIYYFVFGIILGRGDDVENFAIHLFAGMVVVHFFTETFNAGTRSIVRNKALVQKMAMPREMFPFASMLVSLYHTGRRS